MTSNDEAPEMCTAEARELGCTCHIPAASAYDLDPPEPKRDRSCPVHGDGYDPDEHRERRWELQQERRAEAREGRS